MKSMGGSLAYGLTLFMLVGGLYNIAVAGIYWGGGVWLITGILLLPPLQRAWAQATGKPVPPPVSLGLFVLGFLGGVLLP